MAQSNVGTQKALARQKLNLAYSMAAGDLEELHHGFAAVELKGKASLLRKRVAFVDQRQRAGVDRHGRNHRIQHARRMSQGSVDHADSLGNTGSLEGGDVQWMTAGSGILHQEMPKGNASGQMHGFQLWANLPSTLKMTAPRYQDVKSRDIPEVTDDDGTRVRVIVGEFWGKRGPVDGIAADPQYLDIQIPAGVRKTFRIDTYRRAFAYIFEGSAAFADASDPTGILLEKEVAGEEVNIRDMSGNRTLVRFGTGDEITVQAGEEGVRFLLISGAPIQEPVAWHGPIVMNTREELHQAFRDLQNDTFIKPAH